MKKSETNAAPEVQSSAEFSNQRVPMTARKGFLNLLTVSLGYVFVVTSMQAGGNIGAGLNFKDTVLATLLSSAILAVLACAMGVIASKSGLSLGLLSKFSFGKAGTYVPVAIVVVTTIGWFSIDAYLIGQSTNTLFPIIPIVPIAILGGVGMTLTAMRGMKWMTYLSNLAVPLIIIFGAISMGLAVHSAGGVSGMMAIPQENPVDFGQAVAWGVGSYAVGAVMFTPDIMRFAKNAKTAVIVMIITMMLGNTFMLLSGAIGSVVTGTPDVAIMLSMQGLLAPAFLVLVLNIWSTAQGCVYSGSMSLNSVVPKVKRTWLVIGFGVIGIIFALVGFYNYFGTYIDFLSSTVPPLAGIFLADFLVTYKRDYPETENVELPTINIAGFIAWIVGFLASKIPFGMSVINCIIVAFVVKAVLGMVMGSGAKKKA
ncbi:cytosine permease [Pseudoflavonifractor sp. BIOML-A11]|nr:cytosine permease [Pseudoflavonifractor sp. BIOML-A11]